MKARARVAYFTLPLWGTVLLLAIIRLFHNDTNGLILLMLLSLPLIGALPIYTSDRSLLAKMFVTLLYFLGIGFVQILVGWAALGLLSYKGT